MQEARDSSRKFVGGLNLGNDFRRRFQGNQGLDSPGLPLQSPALSYDAMTKMHMIPTNLLTPGLGFQSPQFFQGPFPHSPALSMNGYQDNAPSPLHSPPLNYSQQVSGYASLPLVPMGRTIYIGNIEDGVSAEEIIGLVKTGAIESVRLLPDKNCAFISFLDAQSATLFHTDATMRKLTLHDKEVKVGWGKPSALPANIQQAVQQSGATRNVYLGNLPGGLTEQQIRDDLEKFGAIDQIRVVGEKNIAFVHFLNISSAIKVVHQLPLEPSWSTRRVYYGKDRCTYVSKQQQNVAAQNQAILGSLGIPPMQAMHPSMSAIYGQNSNMNPNFGNRTVYLGNIHPDTTLEEICNVVRGGILHNIRYIPDKHICFVTFVDSNAAIAFFSLSNVQGLMIHNRRLKIGWGKHSGPLPAQIALAVGAGASRNVYVGNIEESLTEEQLKADFSEYGDIELVNTLREKNCAFINFTNLSSAIKAIDGAKSKDGYKDRYRVNYGKDRCGNPSKSRQLGATGPTIMAGQYQNMMPTHLAPHHQPYNTTSYFPGGDSTLLNDHYASQHAGDQMSGPNQVNTSPYTNPAEAALHASVAAQPQAEALVPASAFAAAPAAPASASASASASSLTASAPSSSLAAVAAASSTQSGLQTVEVANRSSGEEIDTTAASAKEQSC